MRKLLWVLLLTSGITFASDPGSDLPKMEPKSATGFACRIDGALSIVAIVVTYKDGTVARFDNQEMHGFTMDQAVRYAGQAKDTAVYAVICSAPKDTKHEII